MKTIIVISLFLFSTHLFAQGPAKPPIVLSAGDHLVKAGNNFIAGIVIAAAGTGIGLAIQGAASDSAAKKMSGYLIGASAGIGLICEIIGASHLIQAGKILNKNRIGVSINQNGLGISYRLVQNKHY